MEYYSTNNPLLRVNLHQALFQGLPSDNGLYMPTNIPTLSQGFITGLSKLSFQEIAYHVAHSFLQQDISSSDLQDIIEGAINFPAPIRWLDDSNGVLELFHGPTLAFKDFGARFMSALMGHYTTQNSKETIILVATSGDTGGAVASGFYKTPGIKVVILYPSGKVSEHQEKQLTTLGNNIIAIEVKGTFDDCQDLVKCAFLDKQITSTHQLSSANSINIARLIPQSFYYFEAFKQITKPQHYPVFFSVPSGNFGNLTAGIFAKRMGLPIHHFLAATNANDVMPIYLKTGLFTPRPSISTLSNAMDVGKPSNFVRIMNLYSSTWNKIRRDITGYSYSDTETIEGIMQAKSAYNYLIDPHGTVGLLASHEHSRKHNGTFITLATAHPSKFAVEMESIVGEPIDIPEKLSNFLNLPKHSILLEADYASFREWILAL